MRRQISTQINPWQVVDFSSDSLHNYLVQLLNLDQKKVSKPTHSKQLHAPIIGHFSSFFFMAGYCNQELSFKAWLNLHIKTYEKRYNVFS